MPTITLPKPSSIRPRRSDTDYSIPPADIEEADYPDEFAEELDRRFERAKLKIAEGELRPMTDAEIAIITLGVGHHDILRKHNKRKK